MDFLGIANIAAKVIDKFIPDPQAKAEALFKLKELEQKGELAQLAAETDLAKGQLEINKIEAASNSLFVAGARPFIMWVCGVAFAYKFIIQPFLIFTLIAFGSDFDFHKLPLLDWTEMSPVLLGLLGLGGMRTYEKKNGIATK